MKAEKKGSGVKAVVGISGPGESAEAEKRKIYIRSHIDKAVEQGWLKVYYQPIVHVLSRELCAYEGLVRWDDPEYGLLEPGEFIGTLVESWQIHKIDLFMVRQICSDLRASLDAGKVTVPVSVNLSVKDFQVMDMESEVNSIMEEFNLPKIYLHIEITELALEQRDENIISILRSFQETGYEIWLDNFGTRYSSLNLLEEIEVNVLKIDAHFLKKFHHGPRGRIILKKIVDMSKELGVQTLIEGVEDDEALDFLMQIGCEMAQGFLFGEPLPIEELDSHGLNPEDELFREYYDAIGRVNLLSQTPLQTGWFHAQEDDVYLNGMPLAVAEFVDDKFHFLMSNKPFDDVFEKLNTQGGRDPESVFNNYTLQFAVHVHEAAQQCVMTGHELSQDFITSDGFHNLKLRCISYNAETDNGALLLVVEHVTGNPAVERQNKQENVMRFLYTLYSRIDLFRMDGKEVDNIYLNSAQYKESFIKGDVRKSVSNFAERNVYKEDQENFIDFLNLDTFEERLWEVGGNHITDYFRTRDGKGNYTWQMYLLIPVVLDGKQFVLCCSRGIDAERMRRLPEIDRMGAEYYDMPGNPVFLLLASRAFTSTLGYGSFEQFLENSFYVEASISKNKTLYMHLGQQGVVSQLESVNLDRMTYEETINDMIRNTAVPEHGERVEEFFDRKRLLAEYKNGKKGGEMEYLRRPDEEGGKPRYLHTNYYLREEGEGDDIRAYFLSFDIDAYRRTNENLIELAERCTLTGLYNRTTATRLIREYLDTAEDKTGALVILDLDFFKQVNDRWGHDCGDAVLRDAASRMEQHFGENGVVSRIGGDEFLILLKDVTKNDVEKILWDFVSQDKVVNYHGHIVEYTMSIGYAMYPAHGKDYAALYQNADQGLYSVKMAGRNGFRAYDPDAEPEANRQHMGFSVSQISEGMPGGFLVYRADEEGEILFANSRLLSIYECDSFEELKELTGDSFKGCVHEDDWDFVQKTIQRQSVENDGYDYVRYRAITKKGNIRQIEDFGRKISTAEDGDIFYVFMLDLEDKQRLYRKAVPWYEEEEDE